jgi:predicted O-methyltransferase YrrM
MIHFYQNLKGWFDFPTLYKHIVEISPTNSHFAEIGSWQGMSASFLGVEIHNSKKNIKLDCIDTWEGSTEHTDDEFVVKGTLYETFIENIQTLNHIINPIKMDSRSASKLYDDNSLDFVFLDASHDYESVKEDLNLWYPKVKPGCMFSGHDYHASWPGVIKAVNEFAVNNKFPNIKHCDISCWSFIKK